MNQSITHRVQNWYRLSDIRFRRSIGLVGTYIFLGFLIGMYNYQLFCPNSTPEAPVSFLHVVGVEVLGGILGGLACSYIMLYFFYDKLTRRSALFSFLVQFLTMVVLIVSVGFLCSMINNGIRLSLLPFHPTVIKEAYQFILTGDFIRILMVWGSIISLSYFYFMVADKYGPGQIWKSFLGHYRRPQETNRIFMFLDIKDSTQWAERLGHHRYFEFLRDFFDFLAPAIMKSNGEIYQYVGDEIVISWPMEIGKYKGNAVKAFFACQEAIRQQAEHFRREYGQVPRFKAGMHAGKVMTGELGRIKKELVYSGVAISAASRIQHLCRRLEADFLLSESLFMHLELNDKVSFARMGAHNLKGVEADVDLIKIEKPLENWYFESAKADRKRAMHKLEIARN